MFITFEGADGSGKTTQAKLLATFLQETFPDKKVVWTREPGGSPGAEEVRRLLLSGEGEKWSAETELLLFNAARRDHVERVIRPTLEAGGIVVCDRYVGTTFAYQGVRGDGLLEKAKIIHETMIGLDPDLTILLDRPMSDKSVSDRGLDRMEVAQEAFRMKSRRQFITQLKQNEAWHGVFAEDMDAIHDRIKKIVSGHMRSAPADRRIFMDEAFLVAQNDLVLSSRRKTTPDLFSSEKTIDVLRFGADVETNPFAVSAIIEHGDEGVEKITPNMNGHLVEFMDISEERAQAIILERVEKDIPELGEVYSPQVSGLTF